MSITGSEPPTEKPDGAGLIVTSGLPGHERSVPGHDIPPPTAKVRPGFVVAFAFAQLALFVALLGPVMVSMAIKVTAVVGPADAPTAAGLILGVGALAALIGNPVFGRLSDRTTSRWGRRRPWLVGGGIGLALCLFVIAVSDSVPILMIAWFVGQLAANAAFAAYLASVADQVPPSQTATITALAGVMQNVGILAAVYLASALTDEHDRAVHDPGGDRRHRPHRLRGGAARPAAAPPTPERGPAQRPADVLGEPSAAPRLRAGPGSPGSC